MHLTAKFIFRGDLGRKFFDLVKLFDILWLVKVRQNAAILVRDREVRGLRRGQAVT